MLSSQEHKTKKSKTNDYRDAVSNYKAVLSKHNLSFAIDPIQLSKEFKTQVFMNLMSVSESTKFKYSQCFTDQAKIELINTEVSLTDNPYYAEVVEALNEVKHQHKLLKDKGVYSGSLDTLFNDFALDINECLDKQLIVIDPQAMAVFEDITKNVNKVVKLLEANDLMSGYNNYRAVWEFMQHLCSAEVESISLMTSKITGYKVNEHNAMFIAKKYDLKAYKK